jgi:hypothetical protein
MYRLTKAHKRFVASTGDELVPVATLKDDRTANMCHIVRDEDSYALYLRTDSLDGFVLTPYIFPEAHQALASLPSPDKPTLHEE